MKSIVLSLMLMCGFVGYANATDCHANNVIVEEFVDYVPVRNVLFLNHANFANVEYNVQRNFVRVVRDRNIKVVNKVVQEKVVVRNRLGLGNRLRGAFQALTQRNAKVEVRVERNIQRIRNVKVH